MRITRTNNAPTICNWRFAPTILSSIHDMSLHAIVFFYNIKTLSKKQRANAKLCKYPLGVTDVYVFTKKSKLSNRNRSFPSTRFRSPTPVTHYKNSQKKERDYAVYDIISTEVAKIRSRVAALRSLLLLSLFKVS